MSQPAPKRQRIRKANFTAEEKELVVDTYERFFKIIKMRMDDSTPEPEKASARLQKREVLEGLARRLTLLGVAERTAIDVRQKIIDYEKAVKEFEQQRPSRSNRPRELSPIAERFYRIMKRNGESMAINAKLTRRRRLNSGSSHFNNDTAFDDDSDLESSATPSSLDQISSVNPIVSAFMPLMKVPSSSLS